MSVSAKLFAGDVHGLIDRTVLVSGNNTDMCGHDVRTQFFGQLHDTLGLVDLGTVLRRVLEAMPT
ncbi:hypothetical protein D3C72_2300140 [compost metagenome]